MDYKKGERVRHPTKYDWGLGEVLSDSSGNRVRIFFIGVGEKLIELSHIQPLKVTGDEATHPVLNNLKIKNFTSGIKYQSLSQSIQFFQEQFPGEFCGQRFTIEEREYKYRAHVLALELLGEQKFHSLLANKDYQEITKRVRKVVDSTNLIFPNEKMALKDGLIADAAQKNFSMTLYELLFGERDLKQRFEAFLKVLEDINAAKWTIVSYFLFILLPEKYMFVKPEVTKYVSELCGFEVNYKPQLNWLTYKSVLDFSNYLFSEISGLKPRDMIDVQSFMWCIASGKYKSA